MNSHLSSMALEQTPFGQIQAFELHGSAGTLHGFCDYDKTQSLKGAQVGEGPVRAGRGLLIKGHEPSAGTALSSWSDCLMVCLCHA